MENGKKRLEFYGGMAGLLISFCVLFAGIITLAMMGKALPMAFWVPALGAMLLAILLAKDKRACAESMVHGMSSEMVAIMIMAWFLAGIVAKLMTAAGLVEGLIWLTTSMGLHGRWFPLITFVIGSLLSTATGTAIGTVIALAPILYPVGVALGANPPVMLASIVSAAYFGDNIAPVSDTTIASAYTQGIDVASVVRSRLKYAFMAAGLACIGFIIFGGAGDAAGSSEVMGAPKGLIMLLVPAILIFMMQRGVHLIVALLSTAAFGIVLGLVTQLLTPADLFSVDMDAFAVHGVIVDGMMSLIDIAVFAMLLMALIGLLEDGGVFDMLLSKVDRFTKTPRSAEITVSIINIILNLLTVANSVVIVMEGPFARRVLVDKHNIRQDRSANILDAVACGAMCLIPYGFAPLLAYMFAGSNGPLDFNVFEVCLYSFHGWGLLIVMFMAMITGFGRHFREPGDVSRGEGAELEKAVEALEAAEQKAAKK